MKKHRVLVVDDSRSVRMLIAAALASHADIEIVGEAADPYQAREAIKVLNPDVVTLDIEMPKMNGIEFLEKLMRLRPTPVVMVSSHTGANTELTLKALEIGAVDCVEKPKAGGAGVLSELADKIRIAAQVRFHQKDADPRQPGRRSDRPSYRPNGRIVAIGSSTGGVEALSAVLEHFPANCPPTVITQHMPANFTKSFARRLDNLCGAEVMEAYDGAPLDVGRIYIAPGGEFHLAIVGHKKPICTLLRAESVNGHRPSVDVLFGSIAKTVGPQAVGVILTGMGQDGAQGLLAMRTAGARTIGQDERTSLIYGMPRIAFELGAVERQVPLDKVGPAILTLTQSQLETVPCR